ncbi:hypothetical protein LZC95_38805 [Pendulispora brunnea]|uniref:Uncharacterized protein n=1 Tax=Pendulispora brunnea TaxID=2905690 RepID=A0ABZ2K6F7_9BACT
MRNIVTAAAVALLLGLSSTASAADATEPKSKEPATEVRWYGYQTFLSDAASTALIIGAAHSENVVLATLGAGTYLVGGPLIHVLNGHPQAVGPSVAVRLGIPAVGGLIGAGIGAATSGGGDWSGLAIIVCGLVGVAGGASIASIIDATTFAKQTKPRFSSFSMGVAPTQGGFTIGAAGTF